MSLVGAQAAPKRLGDFVVTCYPGPLKSDYVAETQSGVPLTDSYAVDRGLDKGLVRLMGQDGRRVKSYSIPRAGIRAMLRVARVGDMPDRLDLLFTAQSVTAVHTDAGDAGIFTGSDIYSLAYAKGGVDVAPLTRELKDMLASGLKAYPPGRGCVPPNP